MFGPHWQTNLARSRGVSDRTVRRWVADGDMPPGAWRETAAEMRARAKRLEDLANAVDEAAEPV